MSKDQDIDLVDGGLLSNFPAWVFDEERLKVGPLTPTLGFRLVEQKTDTGTTTKNFFSFAQSLFSTALDGDAMLEVRQIANLQIIPLHVSVSAFDFNISRAEKDRLYLEGLNDGRGYFIRHAGPVDQASMSELLEVMASHMKTNIGKGDVHLRANVLMPIDNDLLKILYTWNMQDDADDQLEFCIDAGAAGCCWQTRDIVPCDLNEAKVNFATRYKMTKYQQALVRPSLQSLMCTPVFDKKNHTTVGPNSTSPLIAVLSFDSDENLLREFCQEVVQQAAANCSKILADKLNP